MDKYKPRNILITGGAGFIGSHFVRYLLQHDEDIVVVNVDALTYAGSIANISDLIAYSNHHFIHGNILDEELIGSIFDSHQIDTVIHFAAETHVDNSILHPANFLKTNIMGTYVLLEAAKRVWKQLYNLNWDLCRFHHISTDEVFGSLQTTSPAFTENSPYAPNSPYSVSKASSDFLVRAYSHTYGLPYTMSNCSNNYGPFQHSEKFIPTVINSCLQQKPIPIYGNGSNIRDWLYVEDHCQAIDTIIRKASMGSTYNIGGNCETSNLNLATTICSLMDELYPANAPHKRLITFVDDRAGHDWRYANSNKKITTELGWMPKNKLEDNLRKTILWYEKMHSESLMVTI